MLNKNKYLSSSSCHHILIKNVSISESQDLEKYRFWQTHPSSWYIFIQLCYALLIDSGLYRRETRDVIFSVHVHGENWVCNLHCAACALQEKCYNIKIRCLATDSFCLFVCFQHAYQFKRTWNQQIQEPHMVCWLTGSPEFCNLNNYYWTFSQSRNLSSQQG